MSPSNASPEVKTGETARFPQIKDAWPNSKPFALNGFLDRNGFTPIWTLLLVFFVSIVVMLLVSVVGMVIGMFPDIAAAGPDANPEELIANAEQGPGLLIGMNALALLFAFGLVGWIAAKGSSKDAVRFLRMGKPDLPSVGLAVFGWIVLLPGMFWIGYLNQKLPLPAWLEEAEAVQVEMLENALLDPSLGVIFLLITIALAPALFEEIMFRGYLQRQVERKWGSLVSILLIGIFFGAFHLRVTQLVPLAMLGCYFGYVTWASGSIWTASIVHLLNNGVQVIAVVRARNAGEVDMSEALAIPWYFGIASLLVVGGVCVAMRRRREMVVGTQQDAQPVKSDILIEPPAVLAT